jgi:tRNA threonylcarbamoyladenosine biosynthesis protein TsaE
VVAFHGDLGAGKTTMIKGICAGLGVTDTVKSPSFVIVTEYRGGREIHHQDTKTQSGQVKTGSGPHHQATKTHRAEDRESGIADRGYPLSVYHVDLYRLRGPADLEALDFDSYLDGSGVCLVEWAERAEGVLPERTIKVVMTVEDAGRRIEIAGAALQGPRPDLRSTVSD